MMGNWMNACKIVRIQASYAAACLFCIDMNSFRSDETHITKDELMILQGRKNLAEVDTFSKRENWPSSMPN
jgi:hypothetical protein